MKTGKILISLFFGAVLAASSFSSSEAQEPIKVGLLTPLTGPAAVFGLTAKQGFTMALEDINAKGGVNGKKLEAITYDSQSKPAVAATLTQRLILEDKVPLVCVGTGSIDALAMMEVTEKAKIPLLICASASPVITEKGYKWVWRQSLNDKISAEILAKYVSSKPTWNRMAILHENSDYGRPPSEILEGLIKKTKGKQIVAMESFNRGDTDISGQLVKIKKTNPDLLVTWGYYPELALISRQKQQIGLKVQEIGNSTMVFSEYIQLGGAATEGAMFTVTVNSHINPDPGVQAFVKRYEQKFNKPLGLVGIDNYNGAIIAAEVLKKAGTNPEKIQNALNTMTFPGVACPLKFDAKGQRIIKAVIIGKVEGGKHKFVEMFAQ
jgi:branched-chain amino acid transport system substrate-binding protein